MSRCAQDVPLPVVPATRRCTRLSRCNVITVPANDTLSTRLYVEAVPDSGAATKERTELRLWVSDATPQPGGKEARVHHDTVFNGKAQ